MGAHQLNGSSYFHIPRLTEEEFREFSQLIYKESGINLKENKVTLLSNRLRKRLRELHLPDYQSYLAYVRKPENRYELVELMDVVSTNETYFFRNYKQFDALTLILPQLVEASGRRVRLWSAGCSTGEEPYTMAIVLAEHRDLFVNKQIEILATDLSHTVLAFAQRGIYSGRRIEKVSAPLLAKYFEQLEEGDYRINDEIRSMISFERHNLFQDPYPENLDVIFNRNVMIYFDKEHQRRLVNGFANVLKDHGYLFIGHAETLYNLTDKFQYQKIGDSPVYLKQSSAQLHNK